MIHHLSGLGGGHLAVYNDQGEAKFLSNNSEDQTTRSVLGKQSESSKIDRSNALGNHEDYFIRLIPSQERSGKRDLEIIVIDVHTSEVIAQAALPGINSTRLLGGIAMVSHGG